MDKEIKTETERGRKAERERKKKTTHKQGMRKRN